MSFDASTSGLYLTSDLPNDTAVQYRLEGSGLVDKDIIPEPGWRLNAPLTLEFSPALRSGVNVSTWRTTHVATLAKGPNTSTRVSLVSQGAVWASVPLETIVLDDAYRLLVTPYTILGRGYHRVVDVEVSRSTNSTSYAVSGTSGEVRDGVLLLSNTVSVGTHVMEVEATAGADSANASVQVVCEALTQVAPNVESVNMNLQDSFTLFSTIFDTGSGPPTHASLVINNTVNIKVGDSVFTADDTSLITVEREDLSDVTVVFLGGSVARGVRATGLLGYWLSFDGGLAYVHYGVLSVDPFPCFDVRSRVCTGFRNGGMIWRRITDLKPGDTVMDDTGKLQTVRSTKRTKPLPSQIVDIPRNTFGPGVPNRDMFVTTNHRVRVPMGGAASQCMRAGVLPAINSKTTLLTVVEPICHVETANYCFLIVNGMRAESWARRPAQLAQRDGRSVNALRMKVKPARPAMKRHTRYMAVITIRKSMDTKEHGKRLAAIVMRHKMKLKRRVSRPHKAAPKPPPSTSAMHPQRKGVARRRMQAVRMKQGDATPAPKEKTRQQYKYHAMRSSKFSRRK